MLVDNCKYTCPGGATAYLVGCHCLSGGRCHCLSGGLTVIIRLVSVQVKLYLNCQLELSLAKITYKINFLIKWGHFVSKKILGPKNVGSEKTLGPKKCWSRKNFLGEAVKMLRHILHGYNEFHLPLRPNFSLPDTSPGGWVGWLRSL